MAVLAAAVATLAPESANSREVEPNDKQATADRVRNKLFALYDTFLSERWARPLADAWAEIPESDMKRLSTFIERDQNFNNTIQKARTKASLGSIMWLETIFVDLTMPTQLFLQRCLVDALGVKLISMNSTEVVRKRRELSPRSRRPAEKKGGLERSQTQKRQRTQVMTVGHRRIQERTGSR
jgi:hypothetical protein